MERATVEDATKVVNMLLASFPQQAHDPKTYARQLANLCVGSPMDVLEKMVNPRCGLLAEASFLPSVAQVSAWLDENTPKPHVPKLPPQPLPEHRHFPPIGDEEPNPTSEERATGYAKYQSLKLAKVKTREGKLAEMLAENDKISGNFTHGNDLGALRRALANLESERQ